MASQSIVPQERVFCKHPSCNCSFKTEAFMSQHFTDVHMIKNDQSAAAKQGKIRCKDCSIVCENESALDQHRTAVHVVNESLISKLPSQAVPVAAAAGTMTEVSCNDCGKQFKSVDYLHQHQWDSPEHTRVSKSRPSTSPPECSRCSAKAKAAKDLEQHFMDCHPLSELPKTNEAHSFQQIELRFTCAWKHSNTKLHSVHKIFKVYNMGFRTNAYEAYRKKLKQEAKGPLMKGEENAETRLKVLNDGNELQRFHGTRVKCSIGEGGSAQRLCTDNECNLCRILKAGFKRKACRLDKFQRFGKGIYVTATSSKANDYVKGMEGKKVMLLCKVLAGKMYRSTQNIKELTSPPPGFHSVQGDPGEVLNYDELVVYEDHAILPAFIILYSSD